jgi:hypothetical protein
MDDKIKVGLIGEFPTDVNCIKSLLIKKYPDIHWFPLIQDVHGSMLENQHIKHTLRKQYEVSKPQVVIFIRDLDSNEEDEIMMKKRLDYLREFNRVVNGRGHLLLNIQELEAILLTDVSILNKKYGSNLEKIEDCMSIKSPKDYIRERIGKYTTGDNEELFAKYDFGYVVTNCRYFKKFIEEVHPKFMRN